MAEKVPRSESYRTKVAFPEFEQLIDTLEEREQVVIKARLRGERLRQIGRYLHNYNKGEVGVTGSRVAMIEHLACRKIRFRIRRRQKRV